jgi:hypothetical protein
MSEASMTTDLLRAPEAARRLEMPTKDLLRLVVERKIRYVIVRGMVHFSPDSLDEYRAAAS